MLNKVHFSLIHKVTKNTHTRPAKVRGVFLIILAHRSQMQIP